MSDEAHELKNLKVSTVQTGDLKRFPYMTGWFEPLLLLKLLWRVIVADVFGQYADRRLMEAALDPATEDEHYRRACSDEIQPGPDGAVWLDYVSDLGDGFDATYAIAYLLAQPTLDVEGESLPRGQVLMMGGDEVYPTALRDDYKVKMRLPYEFARPAVKGEEKTPLYLLPGNHDWYDGLVNFLAIFCRAKTTNIGGWKTSQRRSYFAVKLAENWWLWAIDIALVRDMDQPQADYFVGIAKRIPERANIILCSAEPGWYKAEVDGDAYRTLSYAADIAKAADKDLRLPLVLSGDSHHYARYVGPGGQYITSGGGGAFLHGTLELKPSIKAEWLEPEADLSLQACYPSKETSLELLKGNTQFGALNGGLGWAISSMYLVAAFVLSAAWRLDVGLGIFAVLGLGLWGYAAYQEGNSRKIVLLSTVHATVHMAVILALASFGRGAVAAYPPLDWHWLLRLLLLALPALTVGRWLAGKIYGLNLMLTCRYFGVNHNDAFSSMKLNSHRHFLRLRLQGDTVKVYPIKLEQIPEREQWRENPARATPGNSVFISDPPMKPELIEPAIVIQARKAVTTDDVKSADELPTKS